METKIFLYLILLFPLLIYPALWITVLIQELGHAFAYLITGIKIIRIEINFSNPAVVVSRKYFPANNDVTKLQAQLKEISLTKILRVLTIYSSGPAANILFALILAKVFFGENTHFEAFIQAMVTVVIIPNIIFTFININPWYKNCDGWYMKHYLSASIKKISSIHH